MHYPSPAKIPQRVIAWWKSRSKRDTTDSPEEPGQSEDTPSLQDKAKGIGGRATALAASVRSRGKGAVEQLRQRGQGATGSGSGKIQQTVAQIEDQAKGAISNAAPLARSVVTRASAMRSGSGADTDAGTATSSPAQDQASSGSEAPSASAEPELSIDPSSVAWASTAGVIDPEVGNPSHFIEAEQTPASAAAQDAGDPDTTPADRAAATPGVDTSVMVSGNSEEGTHNEAASAATQASTNTAEDKPVVQAPTDATGGPEDRLAGTGSTETSSAPFAYSASGEGGSGTPDVQRPAGDSTSRNPEPASASSGSAAAPAPSPARSSGPKITFVRRETETSPMASAPDAGAVDTGSVQAPSVPAPVGGDGLPIYFDTDDGEHSAAQSSDLGGLKAMEDFPAGAGESRRGVQTGGGDAGNARRPEPGSSIPDFATDAESSTRIVESPTGSNRPTRTTSGRESITITRGDAGEAPEAGSGVTMRGPTSGVSGDVEPAADPALGRARAGEDTVRRGTSGLGAAGSGSSSGAGSFDDVQVADAVSTENSGTGMESPDAVTQQDVAGAVDTKDPESISRSVTRNAGSTNSGSTSGTSSSRGRSRRQRKSKSDERSGR